MATPIDAVRFHSTFGEADYWLREEEASSSHDHEENLAPARGAVLGLVLGGLLWVGLIAGFRAVLGL
ncbi:MAG TPA: hypothetical protein VHX13_04680 [Acidobacteriaceae bacterium]|jgi:hypothetical protein|nr:hypothetical protein [Acidobacteriaceae bacterium]